MRATYFTEAGTQYGLGHLKRCEAIAQLMPELCLEPILNESSDLPSSKLRKWSLSQRSAYRKIMDNSDVVFVDTFLGDREFFEDSNRNKKVIYIDDFLYLNLPYGLVIDWTIGAEKYRKPVGERYAFGIEYLVTRSVFKNRSRNKNRCQIETIVTIFGGADPLNLTPKFYDLLSGNYKLKCLGTSYYPCATQYTNHPDFRFDLSDEQLVFELLEADLVISAGGQMIYELAVLGLPTIALSIIENQNLDIKGFQDAGLVRVLDTETLDQTTVLECLDSLDIEERDRMSQAMIQKVGDGSQFRECVGSYLCL